MKVRVNVSIVMMIPLLLLAACSKKTSTEESEGGMAGLDGSRVSIPLEAVQTEAGCLSAPLYTLALRQLRSDLPLIEVTTHLRLHGGRGVREPFRLLTAFGNFKFEAHTGTERIDLHGLAQDGCKSLKHTAADGTQEEYRIVEARPDFILAEAPSGNMRSYRWLSPERVEIATRHKALDLPCTAGHSLVDLKQVLDWTGNLPATVEKTDPLYVEDSFVEMLAAAAGTNAGDYYTEFPATDTEPAHRAQLTGKLRELAKAGVRQELLVCTGTPPPPPTPEDPQNPSDPGSPEDRPAPPPPVPVDPVPGEEPVPTPDPGHEDHDDRDDDDHDDDDEDDDD